VEACGLDLVYPPEHARLAQEIVRHGALVSEHPPGTQPRSEHFPRRNRILSGISLGVLVAEGGEDSGALITARRALDQSREVFAVPGSIYAPTFRGSNGLIRDSQAKLVLAVEDIVEELNLTMATHQIALHEVLPSDPTEAALLGVLSNQPVHIDDVQRSAGLPIATVAGALAMLELKGLVRQVGSMSYVKAREVALGYSTN
jgi:DNA processing protein